MKTVQQAGGLKALAGKWKYTGERDNDKEEWLTNMYDSFPSLRNYYCFDGQLKEACPFDSDVECNSAIKVLAGQARQLLEAKLEFKANGTGVNSYKENYWQLVLEGATCDATRYNYNKTVTDDNVDFAWTYNADTKMVTFIYASKSAEYGPDVWSGKTEITGNKLVVTYDDGYQEEYTRQ